MEGFEVKADALRYYDISAIYRNYYADIDDGLAEGDTSTIGGYAIEVAKLFTACTVNGEVSYTCTDTTVVTIRPEQKYVGYVRYLDGYQMKKCSPRTIWRWLRILHCMHTGFRLNITLHTF